MAPSVNQRRTNHKLEPDLFLAATGLTVKDFHLLVRPQGVQHRANEIRRCSRSAATKTRRYAIRESKATRV